MSNGETANPGSSNKRQVTGNELKTTSDAGISTDKKTRPVTYGIALRCVGGGVLMGMANLVPGISGGTMLLAAGIYPRFIGSVADVTSLKWRRSSLLTLALVLGATAVTIPLLAGTVKDLVINHQWIMYSLFIGLTLGGVPVVWKMIDRMTAGVWTGAFVGFVVMAAVASIQSLQVKTTTASDSLPLMFTAGVIGASAMILPGISGGYLMLVLGVYVPVLGAIDTVREAVETTNFQQAIHPTLTIILPLGIGVVIGVVAVSNALKWLLARYAGATLGVLLGLLIGAVIGLWPFQEPVKPVVGQVVKGQVMTKEKIGELKKDDWPTRKFTPATGHIIGAIGLALVGFAMTMTIARFSNERKAVLADEAKNSS
jgi:putative membrane protein